MESGLHAECKPEHVQPTLLCFAEAEMYICVSRFLAVFGDSAEHVGSRLTLLEPPCGATTSIVHRLIAIPLHLAYLTCEMHSR